MKFLIFILCLIPCVLFAQVANPVEAPAWLIQILTFLSSIPKVGPILSLVIGYVSALAGIFTALSVFLLAICKIPEITARWAGAHAFADKISAIYEKVAPWLQYLSIFNVQKK